MLGWIRRYQIKAITEPVLPEALRPETTLISKWFMPPSEPTRTAPRAPDFPSFFFDPNPITTTPYDPSEMGWLTSTARPPDPAPRASDFTAFWMYPGVIPDIDPDKMTWFREMNQPPNPRPRASDFTAFWMYSNILTDIDPNRMSWFREMNQPPDPKPRAVEFQSFAWHSITGPDQEPPVIEDEAVDVFAPRGGDDYLRKRQRSRRERLIDDVRAAYSGIDTSVDPVVADEVAELIAPYAPTSAPDLPASAQIDWQVLLEENEDKLKFMLNTLRLLEAKVVATRRQILEDEEAAIVLLLT